jgi:predicted DNA-binding protein
MSIPDIPNGRGGVKTLAIRLEPDQHAQLSFLAQLQGRTITDELRTAVETHIRVSQQTPELAARASQVLGDIEREASQRRQAIANLFGSDLTEVPTDQLSGTDADSTSAAAEPSATDSNASQPTATVRSISPKARSTRPS